MNVIKFLHRNVLYILIGLILILNVIFSVFTRVKEIDQLQGKHLLGRDSYFYFRQAKAIVVNGRLPERDYMQNYPDGLDLRRRANLNCYAIAYFHKFARLFVPSISIEKSTIYYPVFCFVLILLIFFRLTRIFAGISTALVAVTLFVALPGNFFRTHAGWADRDALSLLEWLTCVYFYINSHQTKDQNKRYLLLAVLSGILMGILGLTWPGVGSLSVIIVVFNAVKLLTHDFSRKDFYIYLCWYASSIAMMLIFSRRYTNFDSVYAFSAIGVPTAFLMLAVVDILIGKLKSSVSQKTLYNLLAAGSIALLFTGPMPPTRIIHIFLKPAGTEPLIKYISEFYAPNLLNWFWWYQLFIVFPIFGFVLVTYRLLKSYAMPAKLLAGISAIFLTTTIFSVLIPSTPQNIRERTYIGFAILFVTMLLLSYFFRPSESKTHRNVDTDSLLFLLIWAFFTLLYTRGVLRLSIFLFPVAIIFGTYAIIPILKFIFGSDRKRILNSALLITFVVLCWELRHLYYQLLLKVGLNRTVAFGICLILSLTAVIFLICLGYRQLSNRKEERLITGPTWIIFSLSVCIITSGIPLLIPYYLSQIELPLISPYHVDAFNFIRDNTDDDSVIAAWWNEGSCIEALGERATIIDQQPNYPLIYSMAGKVFCAETVDTALGFLRSRQATHFLMMPSDAFTSRISEAASTRGTDQTVEIKMFRGDEETSQPQQEMLLRIPDANFSTVTTERYRSCIKEESESVTVEYNLGHFHKATVSLGDISISPKYILFDNERYEDVNGAGGLVITNVNPHNPFEPLEFKHAVYFDEKACNQLAFKLYFLGSEQEHFQQIYPTPEMQKRNTSSFDDIKIWKINTVGFENK